MWHLEVTVQIAMKETLSIDKKRVLVKSKLFHTIREKLKRKRKRKYNMTHIETEIIIFKSP